VPGLDLGDSASFQTAVGSLTLTPRQAYPLYHALGNVFAWLHPGEPARAANLASAVYGALAVGLASLIAGRLADSTVAGLASGLFLAFSYTFWSQAITAEVYTLHLLAVGAALLALLSWAERPTVVRLASFYAIYAIGFGNHLSMILLLPGFAMFLLLHSPRGAAHPLRPRMIALAIVIAAAGALQYVWNFRGLWTELEPPLSFGDALGKFWFDVTKADWRQALVMSVSDSGLQNRPEMYWFDLRQQLGVSGVAVACVGMVYVMFRWPKRGFLLLLVYLSNLVFAWTYNVGDAYIFFLPSHYVLALSAGCGIAALTAMVSRASNSTAATVVGALCVLYPAWRGYDTFPAVDRSWDNRAVELLDRFTTRRPDSAIFGADTNWQVQNAFPYFMRERKPAIPWFVTDELEWLQRENLTGRFQELINANREVGRAVLVTPAVYRKLLSLGYEGAISDLEDVEGTPDDPFRDRVMSVRAGTPYALGILRPDREYPLDRMSLDAVWRWLTGGSVNVPELRTFTIMVGQVGQPPALIESQDRPYRVQTRVETFEFDVRMESWLPTDTIRRAGFGHVIVGRRHLLALERGISFAALGRAGEPVYSSGIFAPIPRYILGRLDHSNVPAR
jgi:hypothetical protein